MICVGTVFLKIGESNIQLLEKKMGKKWEKKKKKKSAYENFDGQPSFFFSSLFSSFWAGSGCLEINP